MPRLVAFLRAINVGGHRVTMGELRGLFEALGAKDVETFSQLRSAGALSVGFLAAPLRAEARKSLMALKTEIDFFQVHGREVYWLCKKRQSESTFSNTLFERTLKVRTTFRGWNTVARLAARHALSPEAI